MIELRTIRPIVTTGQRRADIFSCRIGMSIRELLFHTYTRAQEHWELRTVHDSGTDNEWRVSLVTANNPKRRNSRLQHHGAIRARRSCVNSASPTILRVHPKL